MKYIVPLKIDYDKKLCKAFINSSELDFLELEKKRSLEAVDYVVIFDDVTASLFPGVVEAVKNIENENNYSIVYFDISKFRSIAIATKK